MQILLELCFALFLYFSFLFRKRFGFNVAPDSGSEQWLSPILLLVWFISLHNLLTSRI